MHRLLIPLFVCLSAALASAQNPRNISVPSPVKAKRSSTLAEFPCNNAGTFTVGQFKGQSNDVTLDTIFLCFRDTVLIKHSGNAVLTGDPVPATPPGIAYGFYTCKPTIAGDKLQDILADPCLLPGGVNGIFVTDGVANGGTTPFFNSGFLQQTFNSDEPLLLNFAPITLDAFAANGFEPVQQGGPPGPCVNVNTSATFQVVYLNDIVPGNISNNADDDCLGFFTIKGGYPEWDKNAIYTIDIVLESNPSVKALIYTPKNQLFHGAPVRFSAPVAGTYRVTIEDGKSCGKTFTVNMGGCTPNNSVKLSMPELKGESGQQICVPIKTDNFANIIGMSFSIEWDTTIMSFQSVRNPNAALTGFTQAANVNTQFAASGNISIGYSATNGITLTNGATLAEVCFIGKTVTDDCTGLKFTSTPSVINMEDDKGLQKAILADTGQVCVKFVPFTMSVMPTDTSCSGNVTLTVTASGGSEPYEVIVKTLPGGPTQLLQIDTSGGKIQLPNLAPGQYEVSVSDKNGLGNLLDTTLSFTASVLGASLDLTKMPTCNGLANGSVTANVFLGNNAVTMPNPGYTFQWTPVVPAPSSHVQTNVPAGNYSVRVTQVSTGCTASASGTLGQPFKVNDGVIDLKPATCTGLDDGSISYGAEGGTPINGTAYKFSWSYQAPGATAPIKLDSTQGNPYARPKVFAGTYFVTITDANGCTFTDDVEITATRTLDISLVASRNTSCNYTSDGSITARVDVTPPFTSPNFSFSWTPSAGTPSNTLLESTISTLKAGTYKLTAVDVTGCSDTASFTVTSPAAFKIDTLSLKDPGCQFKNDGAITVIGKGGTGGPNYNYRWNTNATGASVNGLVPGSYTVTATDANNCRDSLAFSIKVPDPPSITKLDSTGIKCGRDGSLTITSPTGKTFIWTTLQGDTLAKTAKADKLNGGVYVVRVEDDKFCVTIDTFALATKAVLTLSDTTIANPTCFDGKDGSLAIGIAGGSSPYKISWSNSAAPANSTVAFNLKAGTYSFTITDNVNCTLADTFALANPPKIQAIFTDLKAASCDKGCDGGVTVVVNYATTPPTPGNFTFAWKDQNTDSVRANICSGINSVTITDGNNCFLVDSLLIQSPPPIKSDSLFAVSTSCNGGSDGKATIKVSGGNGGPFAYAWAPGGGSAASVTGLRAGDYSVTVTDKNNCTAVFTTNVKQPDSLRVAKDDLLSADITCFGTATGKLGVKVVGGTPQYTYQWTDGVDTVGSGNPVSKLGPGTYSVIITDKNGCRLQSQSFRLNDPPAVIGSYQPIDPLKCNGDKTTLRIDTITGGSGGPYQYSIDNGPLLNLNFPVTLAGGEHYVSYFDRKGCNFTDTLFIEEPDPIVVLFDPRVIEFELGDSKTLTPIITGAVVDSFTWSPAELLVDPKRLQAVTKTFESETYTLTVYDANGCSGVGSIMVEVDANRNVYVPNIFIPGNPSGLNDYFKPLIGKGVEIVNFLRIYDRWGALMFTKDNYTPNNDDLAEGWDGMYKGRFVEPGVYVYIMEVKFLDGRTLLYRGDVTVLR